MSDGTASAVPSDLTDWAYHASGLNKSLDGIGRQVSQAIEDFNRAPQEPRFIGNVDQIGDDVIGYAARNSVVDDWVGKVGQAFMQADHKGVPSGIYRANQEDFRTGLNTASEADLAQLVGDDPTNQADDAANGAELAARLKEAENANDNGRIQTIMRQLQGQSQEFAYRFFNELGPDQTIKTLIAIYGMKDDGLLQTFDNALGQASQHPDWDPNFTNALLDPQQRAWDQRPRPNIGDIQLSMLRYGTFSEDFLTQSADYFLFKAFPVPENRSSVYDALGRNPNAAYDYLTGHYQAGNENLSRVHYLLRYSPMVYEPGENTVLGKLIADAGFSVYGRADNGNQLLQEICAIDNTNWIPDEIRPGIERLLVGDKDHAGYLGSLPAKPPPSHELEQLFILAGANADGSFDPGRMANLQNAMTKWLFDSQNPQKPQDLADWAKNTGLMTYSLIQPLITQKGAKDDGEATFQNFAIGVGTGLVLGFPELGLDAATAAVAGSAITNYVWSVSSNAKFDENEMERVRERALKSSMIMNLAQHGMLQPTPPDPAKPKHPPAPPVDLGNGASIEYILNNQDQYQVTLPDGGPIPLYLVTGGSGDQFSPGRN